ncbi:hypothetical protein ELH26_14375 [Rhizobium leguminosarum]|uniref:hypothetical protein n=1 Tax=Rhizobium TaxID=379 RepID=UPI00102F5D95|nr:MULTISPECIES: hypothetical protein [Rhizobium]TBC95133.1 hypothetical protein ELH26_14375 [Rhizobium leguminosarum]TBE02274.1 hypothetical protein ELH10_15350 [Rhizobium ruizarguesonis]TBF14650.1 hypothetical protein ELG95_14495 [Rhizobium ruizarguesonis]
MNDKWLGTPPSVILPRLRSLLADLEQIAAPGAYLPPKDAVTIRNCILVSRPVPCLIGEMSGHPTIKGPGITSELFFLDRQRKLGRTLSRWYRFDDGLI